MAFGMAPIATLLFYTRRRTRQVSSALSTLVGAGAAIMVPIALAHGRRHAAEDVTWMVAFLGATFGFATFFKCLTVALA
jgi:sirohydrochlorin ferrochelatase